MILSIPATETQIDSSHEGDGLINDDQFFVVRPEQNEITEVVWMPNDLKNRKGKKA